MPAAALPTTAAAEVAVTAAAAAVTAATAVAFAAAVPAVTAAATVAFAAAAATHGQLLGRSTCSGDCRTFHFQQTLELPDCHLTVTVGRSLGLLDCLVSRFLVYQRFEIDKLVSQTLQEVMRRELVAQTDDLIDPATLLLPRRRNCCGLGNCSAGGPFDCFGQTLQPAVECSGCLQSQIVSARVDC